MVLLNSDQFGQVPGEVDVQALSNRKPIGHKLERNDVEQTLKELMSVRNLNLVGLLARELHVVLVADDNGTSLASDDLLIGVERFGEDGVTGEDHDDREVLIDKSKDTMLQFTRHDSFTV